MPTYTVTDPQSGKTLKLTGDSPPSEGELNDIFTQHGAMNDAPNEPAQPSRPDGAIGQVYDAASGPGLKSLAIRGAIDLARNPDVQKGLLTNEPLSDPGPWYKPTVAGTARAAPSVIGAMGGGGPAGAGMFEGIRQGLVAANAAAGNTESPSAFDIVARPAAAATVQKGSELAGPYIEKGARVALNALGTGAKAGIQWVAQNLQGVAPASYEYAKEVGAKAIRPFLNAGTEVADSLAEAFRGAVSKTVKAGEDAYPELIAKAQTNPQYAGKTFNLQDRLGDKVLEIADKFGYQTVPGLKAPPEAAKFWNFAKQVDGLQNASLDQVYSFQKQLNSLARSNAGKPLGAAYGALKDSVRSLLGQEVPEIGQANAQYAAAKALEEQTGGIVNKNDLIKHVLDTYKTGKDTLNRQTLENAAAQVPGLGDVISNIRSYGAAQSFSPMIRGLPQTGFGARAVDWGTGALAATGAGAVSGEPVLAAAGLAAAGTAATALSPRMALRTLQMAQSPVFSSAAQAMAKAAPVAATAQAQVAAPALAEYFGIAPTSTALANFYKSGGR